MSEIEHYGRLGMKWYQHIFGKEQSQAQYAKRNLSDNKRVKEYKYWTSQKNENIAQDSIKRINALSQNLSRKEYTEYRKSLNNNENDSWEDYSYYKNNPKKRQELMKAEAYNIALSFLRNANLDKISYNSYEGRFAYARNLEKKSDYKLTRAAVKDMKTIFNSAGVSDVGDEVLKELKKKGLIDGND